MESEKTKNSSSGLLEEKRKPPQVWKEVICCKDEIIQSMLRFFNNSEMSDVVLCLGNKKYFAHKFVIGLMSDVFRTMCSHRWETQGEAELVLLECEECVPVFDAFLKFMYCGEITVDIDSALPLLMLSDKYNVQPLKRGFEQYMDKTVKHGSVPGALRWLSYAQHSGHVTLQKACLSVIVTNIEEVVECDDFLHLELEFLLVLLTRDDLVLPSEWTLYKALLKWLDFRQSNVAEENLYNLLSLIRFPMMFPSQLQYIENSEFFLTHHDILKSMFALAHRFRSIAPEVHDDAFVGPNFQPRNYTHSKWCNYVTATLNGDIFFQKSIVVGCLNHPVLNTLTVAEDLWQVRIVGDKHTTRGNAGSLNSKLGYNFCPTSSILDRDIQLEIAVNPLKPVRRDVVVDISLFQVKKDRISKHLHQSTLSMNEESDVCKESNHQGEAIASEASKPQPQPLAAPKFSPSPMHFSFMFNQSVPPKKKEVILRYNFSTHDLDHPSEVPCFRFNNTPRLTNSIRVAVIFKPRFIKQIPMNDEEDATELLDDSACALSPCTNNNDILLG